LINGGFFAFRTEIFDFMEDGEELVVQPFQRLIKKQQLLAYKYEGYWGCMDTFKDKQQLEDLYTRGGAPWEVWKRATKERNEIPSEECRAARKKKATIQYA
jgi:glucose-1-phosphate cytidylyltransferase